MQCRLIDTSTAHRVAPGWVYGFPELPGARERIRSSRRIANPGCHASGFIALIYPLVAVASSLGRGADLLLPDGLLRGRQKMIAQYEGRTGPDAMARRGSTAFPSTSICPRCRRVPA